MSKPMILIILALTVIAVAGCATVPEIDGAAKVPVDSVARRVKCDILKIAETKIYSEDVEQRNKFAFLKSWGARVHLTMAVDDTASINPGASLINPLPASQSFTLGAGAGVSTEAIATTDIEFFLSFKELLPGLSDKGSLEACKLPSGFLLESDLRLDALFDTALEPVLTGTLQTGEHPGFAGDTPPPVPAIEAGPNAKAVPKAPIQPPSTDLAGSKQKLAQNPQTAADIKSAAALPQEVLAEMKVDSFKGLDVNKITEENARVAIGKMTQAQLDLVRETGNSNLLRAETKSLDLESQELLDRVIKPEADIYLASFPACAAKINQKRSKSILQAAFISADRVGLENLVLLKPDNPSLNEMRNLNKSLVYTANTMRSALAECAREKAKARRILYDPVDLISQTINFYITSTGSITPTWKLVRVAAPLNPVFASATRKDTNTLIIAFGRPDTSKDGTLTSGPVSNQILTSTLRGVLDIRSP